MNKTAARIAQLTANRLYQKISLYLGWQNITKCMLRSAVNYIQQEEEKKLLLKVTSILVDVDDLK